MGVQSRRHTTGWECALYGSIVRSIQQAGSVVYMGV